MIEDNKAITTVDDAIEGQITQDNVFIHDSGYHLTIDQLRVLNIALKKKRTKYACELETFISSKEYSLAYGVNSRNAYQLIKKAVNDLAYSPVKEPNSSNKEDKIFWISRIGDGDLDDPERIRITFTQEISPYLFELEGNFTTVKFAKLVSFKNTITFRLYQWLESLRKLKRHNRNGVVTGDCSLMFFRDNLPDDIDYDWYMIERIIKKSLDAISKHTDISATYEPLKAGRKTNAVKFKYLDESKVTTMPERPKLPYKPRNIAKGSHEYGVFIRGNRKLILDWMESVKRYDPNHRFSLVDLKKVAEYSKSVGDPVTDWVSKELLKRSKK